MAEVISIVVRPSAIVRRIESLRRMTGSCGSWFAAFAGQPGMGWLVGSLLATNALATVMLIGDGKEADSALGAILGAPFRGSNWGGCRLPSRHDTLLAYPDGTGSWVVEPVTAAERPPPYRDGTVLVRIHRPASSAAGLWSPTLRIQAGRTISTSGYELVALDLANLRAAVVAAWPGIAESQSVLYASTPLKPLEAEAIKTGGRDVTRSIHWGWAANDAFVAFAITVLLTGHPQRAARRRAAAEAARLYPKRLTHCPKCRYAFAGLPTNLSGYRTCPECGKISSQFF